MQLPAHTPLDAATVAAIGAQHGLRRAIATPLPQVGIINAIYLFGELFGEDLILRVPRHHPAHAAQARAEALAIPAAVTVGVRTPRLIAFDDACDLLPVPYSLVERVRGENLGLRDCEPGDIPEVWRELGRDLALLHGGVRPDGPAGGLRTEPPGDDPRELAEARARDGWFTGLEARWLIAWLDRLAPAALTPVAPCCLHLDVQATNIMVGPGALEYLAILDWGCAGWGDPAWDLFGMPLRAVPAILAGHREVAPLAADEGAEARIIWRHLQMTLAVLPRGAAPGLSWGERPLAWLLELLRFFLDAPDERWRACGP